MAVDLNPATSYIDFGAVSVLEDTALISFYCSIDLDSFRAATTDVGVILEYRLGGAAGGWSLFFGEASEKLQFRITWSNNPGHWITQSGVMTAGHQTIGITYDAGSTANDPIIYYNGVSQSIDELITPDGTIDTWVGNDLIIGDVVTANTNSPDGRLADVRIWDEIVTGVDMASLASKKSMRLTAPFPKFRCKFLGATGLQTYDGATLAGGNTFIDDIGGVIGTPTNSPVGASEIYLAY